MLFSRLQKTSGLSFIQKAFFSGLSVKSVPGNKVLSPAFSWSPLFHGTQPPVNEESPAGKYAGVLFTVASQNEALDKILEDMHYLRELASSSVEFRDFLINTSLKRKEQREVFTATGLYSLNEITVRFIDAMVENQRLDCLIKSVEKFIGYCKILNKEEAIKIISADVAWKTQKTP